MKKILKALLIIATTSLVAACGGGGGGEGTPNGAAAVLRLYPPIASVSLPVGAAGSTGVEVRGGKAPFTITSSDASVGVGLSSDNFVLVSGETKGTSEVVIYDSSLPVQTVKISITADSVPMVSSVGTSLNLAPGKSQQVTIRGGEAPYVVSSSDEAVVRVSGSGGSYTITSGTKAGTATVRVLDKANASLDISVTVAVDPLVRSPASISGVAGTGGTIQISGGLAPYSMTSSNSAVVSASGISYSLVAAGSATLNIIDAAGQAAFVAVTVTAAAPSLKVAPTTQTVLDDNTATMTYLIAGGTAPYTYIASAGDASVADISVDNTAKTLTIKPGTVVGTNVSGRCVAADRTVSVDVYDSVLNKETVTLLIKHNTAAGHLCP